MFQYTNIIIIIIIIVNIIVFGAKLICISISERYKTDEDNTKT